MCDGGGDDEDDDGIGLQSPDDDCAMPWSKASSHKPFRAAVFSHFTYAGEAACSPEDMSCATTTDGASDGCNGYDANEWSNLRPSFIPPQRCAAALSLPLPTVAEIGPVFVTRSGRKVKPKKLSLSPPLRAVLAPASPPPLPLAHAISKKTSKKPLVLDDRHLKKEEPEPGQQLELLLPFPAGSTRVFHVPDRSDSCGSVLPLPGCKCRKNGCLRRYCSCFAQSKLCGADCGCSGCKNDGTLRTPLKVAVARITSKNPKAFEPKFVESEEQGGAVVRTGGGCSCRASNCLKRYCECFAAGAACSSSCKCTTCYNKGTP